MSDDPVARLTDGAPTAVDAAAGDRIVAGRLGLDDGRIDGQELVA